MRIVKGIMLVLMFGMLVVVVYTVSASGRGEDDEESRYRALQPARLAAYEEECGACHLAYPPVFLPQRSWQRVFDTLADHFGDDASLPAERVAELRAYAMRTAAEAGYAVSSDSYASARGAAAEPPLRITETRYFLRQHDEIPARLVSGNPNVRSFANCAACHRLAALGSFRESEIVIAGHGRWDD